MNIAKGEAVSEMVQDCPGLRDEPQLFVSARERMPEIRMLRMVTVVLPTLVSVVLTGALAADASNQKLVWSQDRLPVGRSAETAQQKESRHQKHCVIWFHSSLHFSG